MDRMEWSEEANYALVDIKKLADFFAEPLESVGYDKFKVAA